MARQAGRPAAPGGRAGEANRPAAPARPPAGRRSGAALHPAWRPYARWRDQWGGTPPSLAELNAWASASGAAFDDGRPLAFVAPPPARQSALDYERSIARRGEVPTRAGSSHDLWNALAWLAFPRTKSALNAIHASAPRTATGNARDRRRDAATLLDESGVVVACAQASLLTLWREHAWRELFWERRAEVERSMRVAAIGHGLLDKLAAPFRAITARALVVTVGVDALPADAQAGAAALDRLAARRLVEAGEALSPADLLPLPVAALPGWDEEQLGARLFDDTSVFRPRGRSPAGGRRRAGPGH